MDYDSKGFIKMRINELILRSLSRSPTTHDYFDGGGNSHAGDHLSLFRREYPDFSYMVSGKSVVDFGCGEGKQAVALQMEEECNVCAVDTNSNTLDAAKNYASDCCVDATKLKFYEKIPADKNGTFDVVLSQNAMEHFPQPEDVLRQMKRLIHSDGKILITFGPPWFSPYGSHMHFFCKVPWINIFFSENTVMKVRSLYRNDGAVKYEEVESGLNKMTLKKFRQVVSNAGLKIDRINYRVVKNQNWMAKIPFLQELVVNHVTSILVPVE